MYNFKTWLINRVYIVVYLSRVKSVLFCTLTNVNGLRLRTIMQNTKNYTLRDLPLAARIHIYVFKTCTQLAFIYAFSTNRDSFR